MVQILAANGFDIHYNFWINEGRPDHEVQKPFDDIPDLEKDLVSRIIVHCSDTRPSNVIDIDTIHAWHVARGFSHVGYHFVILPSGIVQVGRPLTKQGAHAVQCNKTSIGVCYVGGRLASGVIGDTRTYAQKISMAYVFGYIIDYYPSIEEIIGHNDVSTKWCPCFDARAEYANFVSKYRYGKTL